MDEKKDGKVENLNTSSDEKVKKNGIDSSSVKSMDDTLREKSKKILQKKIEDKLEKQREILSKAAEDEFRSSGTIVSDKIRDELKKFNEISECYSDVAKNKVKGGKEQDRTADSGHDAQKPDKPDSDNDA